jgi:outer membrane protein OmpA-like peptidoglycan-associated protein
MSTAYGYQEIEREFEDLLRSPASYEGELLHEFGGEAFDPTPPSPGAVLLTDFSFGGSTVSAVNRTKIRLAADNLKSVIGTYVLPPQCTIVVIVTGHEDEVGDPAAFGRVGLKRAKAVRDLLMARLGPFIAGLPPGKPKPMILPALSQGPRRPIRSNVTEAGRSMNRRVEILTTTVCLPTPASPPAGPTI